MHDTSFEKMQRFVEVYLADHTETPLRILDVGSQLVDATQQTYRSLFDRPAWRYDGMDVEPGINVDIAVASSYDWAEIPDDSYDLVISGQALEHIEYFWGTAFEIGRVMKPGAVTALIAPSNGFEHRFPVDCWRFYTDGFRAIAAYIEFDVVDVFTDWGRGNWQDSILVMRKPAWSPGERERFHRRATMQRALLGAPERVVAAEEPAASPLATLAPGSLSPVLEGIRLQWHAERAAAQAAASTPAPAATARALVGVAQHREEAARRARDAGVPPGAVRGVVSRLSGSTARARRAACSTPAWRT